MAIQQSLLNHEIRNHPYLKYMNSILDICSPLIHVGSIIDYFAICSYREGKYTGFMCEPNWVEKIFLQKKYHDTIPNHMDYFNNMEHSYEIWSTTNASKQDHKISDQFLDAASFGYKNGITLINKFENGVETYWFSSKKELGLSFYIEHMSELWRFVLYFKEKIYENKELYMAFENDEIVIPNKEIIQTQSNPTRLFEEYTPNKFYLGGDFSNIPLSAKETECLLHFSKGYSAKLIAKKMKISYRTAEKHIAHIFQKAQCNSSAELHAKLRYNPCIQHLDKILL